MKFTEAEKTLLVKNTKQIFEYVEKNICPFLKSSIKYKLIDKSWSHTLVFKASPLKENFTEIELYRNAIDSTLYTLGEKYDRDYRQGVDLFNEYEVMYHLILNWKYIKAAFLREVDQTRENINFIEEFTV